MKQQELVDRLVTAVEEEDVLYVLFWLAKMRQAGLLRGDEGNEGIHLEHSWKNYSALVAAVMRESPSTWRVLILELLLLHVRDPTQTAALGVATKLKHDWAAEMMRKWAVARKKKAKLAQHLITLSVEEAADTIDARLLPHPNADRMTGYGDLPPKPAFLPAEAVSPFTVPIPPGPSTSSAMLLPAHSPTPQLPPSSLNPALAPPSTAQRNLRTLAPTASELGPRPHPSLPPTSWGDPYRQIRLSSLSHSAALEGLRKHLPPLGGLAAMRVLNESTVILSFANEAMALAALSTLQGRQDNMVAQSEADYEASIGHPPRQQRPAAPSICIASPVSAPIGFAPPSSHIRIYVNNAPLNSTAAEICSLLAYTGVEIRNVMQVHHRAAQFFSYHGTVASSAEYERAAAMLHRSTLRTHTLYLQRAPPAKPDPSHPFVVVHDLPLTNAALSLAEAAKRAACGAYELQTWPDGSRAVGSMRVESQSLAEMAVKYLTGQIIGGNRIRVEWQPAAPPLASVAPDAAAGQLEPPPPPPTKAPAASISSAPTSTPSLPAPTPSLAPSPTVPAVPSPSQPHPASTSLPPFPPPALPTVEILDLTYSPPAPAVELPALDSALRSPAAASSSFTSRRPAPRSGYPSPEPTPSIQGSPALERRLSGRSAEYGRAEKRAREDLEEGEVEDRSRFAGGRWGRGQGVDGIGGYERDGTRRRYS